MVNVTPLERAIDRFLLLHLISKASDRVNNLGDTKIQKFVFLSEWQMIDKRDRGFCYFYLKYKKGPYSFDLGNDVKTLIDANIIGRPHRGSLVLTRLGNNIVEDFSELHDRNHDVISIIERTINKYAEYSLQELLEEVYSLPHPYVRGYTIRTASLRMPLLYKLPEEKVMVPFKLNSEQIEDLLVSLSTNGLKHWKAVVDDMQETKYLSYKEVFSSAKC